MSFFDPQKLFASLVSAMGLTPAQIQGFVGELTTELREMRADRLAFKPASITVVNEFRADLKRIEGKLDLLLATIPVPDSMTQEEVNHHVEHYRDGRGPGS